MIQRHRYIPCDLVDDSRQVLRVMSALEQEDDKVCAGHRRLIYGPKRRHVSLFGLHIGEQGDTHQGWRNFNVLSLIDLAFRSDGGFFSTNNIVDASKIIQREEQCYRLPLLAFLAKSSVVVFLRKFFWSKDPFSILVFVASWSSEHQML